MFYKDVPINARYKLFLELNIASFSEPTTLVFTWHNNETPGIEITVLSAFSYI